MHVIHCHFGSSSKLESRGIFKNVQCRVPSWPVERGARCEDRLCANQKQVVGSLRTLFECKQALDILIVATVQTKRTSTTEDLTTIPVGMRKQKVLGPTVQKTTGRNLQIISKDEQLRWMRQQWAKICCSHVRLFIVAWGTMHLCGILSEDHCRRSGQSHHSPV